VTAVTDDQAEAFAKEILEPVFRPNDATLNSVLGILALAAFGYAKGSEKIFLLYGCGRNFKTKLMELMRAVLGGDHFKSINHSQVTSKAHDEKNPYLAGTNGARFVSMSELSKNDVLYWVLGQIEDGLLERPIQRSVSLPGQEGRDADVVSSHVPAVHRL